MNIYLNIKIPRVNLYVIYKFCFKSLVLCTFMITCITFVFHTKMMRNDASTSDHKKANY